MSVLLVPSPVVRIASIAAAGATLLLAAAPATPQQATLPPLETSPISSLSQPAPTHAPPPPDGAVLPNPDRVGIILVMTAADRVIGVWVTGRRGDAAVPSACMALLRDIRGRIVPDRLSKLCAGLPIRRLVRTPATAAIQAAAPAPGATNPATVNPATAKPVMAKPVTDEPEMADPERVAAAVPSTTPTPRSPGSRAPDHPAQPQRRNRLTDDIMIVAVDDRGLYTGAWQAGAARRARISDTCIRMLRRSRGRFLSAAVGRQCGPMLYVARIDDPDPESNPLTVPPTRPPPDRMSGTVQGAVPPTTLTRPAPLPTAARPAPPRRKPTAGTGGSAGTVAPTAPSDTADPPPASAIATAPARLAGPGAATGPAKPATIESAAIESAAIQSAARPDRRSVDDAATTLPTRQPAPARPPPTRPAGHALEPGAASAGDPAASIDPPAVSPAAPDEAAADDLPTAETRVPPAAVTPIHFDVDLTLIEAPLVATAVPLAIARRAGIQEALVATQAAPKAFDPGRAARAAIRVTPPDTMPALSAAGAGVTPAPTQLELFVDADGRFTGRWQRAGDAATIVTPGCRDALAALAGHRVASGPIDPCGWIRPAADDPAPSRATSPPALP